MNHFAIFVGRILNFKLFIMKKITLLLAVLATTVSFAQNELVNRPDDNTTGLISTEGNDGTAVYCADYFEIANEVALGDLTVIGFSSSFGDLTPLMTGFNVYVYEDNGGVPFGNPTIAGTGVVEIDDTQDYTLNFDAATGFNNFTVDITDANGSQVVLQPGNYWVAVAPSVDSPPADAGRWNWAGSLTTIANEPVLIDPDDLFGAGATDWTNISGLIGESFPSFAWILTDEALSVGNNLAEVVSVYPNPASDILNINVPSNIEVNAVAMYDVLGKRSNVNFSNGQINISSLSNGVYILSVETNNGTLTQKIVKN